jgi:hypothetical protein
MVSMTKSPSVAVVSLGELTLGEIAPFPVEDIIPHRDTEGVPCRIDVHWNF